MAAKTQSPAKSGGGTRGGAAMTAAYESLQAYCCAARKVKGSPLEDIKEVKASEVKGIAYCTNSLTTCLNNLDISYHSSCIRTANQIFADYPQLNRGDYMFVRGEGVIHDSIYSQFNKLKKDSGISNANKWNPADIWIIKRNLSFKTNQKTLSELNNYMLELFNKRELIGVSLKKLATKGGAHGEVFNNGVSISAAFTGFKVGDTVDSSKDVYIEFNSNGKSGLVQLRVFSSRPDPSSWQGEIGGKTAAGGKVGGGNLVEAARSSSVPNAAGLSAQTFAGKINKPSESDFKEFVNMWKKIKKISLNQKEEKALIELVKKTQAADKTWWLSKYVGLKYCVAIQNAKKTNEVTNWIFRYGSSSVENSSVFIKYGPG